jgi:DNA mismatch repair protein MSH3
MARDVSSSQPQQPRISAFFSQKPSPTKHNSKHRKRSSSLIDLTLEHSDDEAPSKKRKRTDGISRNLSKSSSHVAEAGPSRPPHAGRAEQWRFELASPEKKIRSTAEEAGRKRNHEAFKKRLLGENSTFIRRGPRESSVAAMDVDSEEHPADNEVDGSRHDSEAAFVSFQELLSNKRGKGKASAAPKTKAEEVGPSGQNWTPLEKQV